MALSYTEGTADRYVRKDLMQMKLGLIAYLLGRFFESDFQCSFCLFFLVYSFFRFLKRRKPQVERERGS